MGDTVERRESMKALEAEIRNLSNNISKAVERMDKVADLVTENRISIRALDTRQDLMTDDIKALETKSNLWDGVNSVFLIIAGVLGISK